MSKAFKCDLCNECQTGTGRPVSQSGCIRLENTHFEYMDKPFWIRLDLCLTEISGCGYVEICDNCINKISELIKKSMLEKLKKELKCN